jgi:hypothetical protein
MGPDPGVDFNGEDHGEDSLAERLFACRCA